MISTICLLLLIIAVELGVLLYRTPNRPHAQEPTVNFDPMFPAFDKDYIRNARIDLLQAMTAQDEAQKAARLKYEEDGVTKHRWVDDLTLIKKSVEAEAHLSYSRERYRRLVQANIAVLNGASIEKVIDEFGDWDMNRIFNQVKSVDQVVKEIQQGIKKKKPNRNQSS